MTVGVPRIGADPGYPMADAGRRVSAGDAQGSEAFGTFWTAPPYLRAAQYDEAVLKENKLPTLSSRPTDSVVRTISDLLEGHAR